MLETKTRPLWRFSDFVVEELPQLLVNDIGVIPSRAEEILRGLEPAILSSAHQSNRELALLDLKMAESAIIRTTDDDKHSRVPVILSNTVDWFCGDGLNIPALQYHELVEVNPLSDMRTFSTGEIRQSEKLFYNSHRVIEHRLSRVLQVCEDFLSSPEPDSQYTHGYESMFDFAPIENVLNALRDRMPTDHFMFFRKYISKPCPVRDFDGPSGAYSCRIPYLESLFWGNKLPKTYVDDIRNKIIYYSPEGIQKLSKRISELDESNCIVGYSNEIPEVIESVKFFIKFMKTFRNSHMGAVRKHLPELLDDKMEGTSGNAEAGTFLKNRITTIDDVYAEYLAEHVGA